MAILICAPDRSNERLAQDLSSHLPGVEIRVWPALGNADEIEFAVLWKHPKGLIKSLPKLKAISSLGAGIEHLVNDPDIPKDMPIGRLAGPKLAHDMALWLVGRVLADWLDFSHFSQLQKQSQWLPKAPSHQPVVGILGMGHMGRATAKAFMGLGFDVLGWSTRGQGDDGISVYQGQSGLTEVASRSDYLICLLPLTPDTRGILNASLFSKMPKDSVLINVGRGAHLVEEDLLKALDQRHLTGAILDVFAAEPLPQDHAFWTHPNITVSPHCAAITDPTEAALLLAQSYQRVMADQAPIGQADLSRGY